MFFFEILFLIYDIEFNSGVNSFACLELTAGVLFILNWFKVTPATRFLFILVTLRLKTCKIGTNWPTILYSGRVEVKNVFAKFPEGCAAL